MLEDQSLEFDHYATSEGEAIQWAECNSGVYVNPLTGVRFRVFPRQADLFDLYIRLSSMGRGIDLSDYDADTVRQAAKAVLELHELIKK